MKWNNLIYISCLLCLLSVSVVAQENTVFEDAVVEETIDSINYQSEYKNGIDSSFLELKDTLIQAVTIPSEKLEEYRSQREFQYKEEGEVKENKNWLNEFIDAIIKFLEDLLGFPVSEGVFEFLRWLFIAGFGFLVGWLIVKYFGINLNFRRKKKVTSLVSFEEIEENLTEIDFVALIREAIKNKSYRVAIRLFFLKNLQSLTKKELIDWEIDKTNNDYKYELKGSDYAAYFDENVYLFEHIWYGNFNLSEEEFQQAIQHFKEFEKQIAYAK